MTVFTPATDDTYATLTREEKAAWAVWEALDGKRPTEPLRVKGGALDPYAYCMQLVRALVTKKPLPNKARDVPTHLDDPVVLAAEEALLLMPSDSVGMT